MKQQVSGGPSGLPYRRINFVPARNPSAHSLTPHVDLVPLNSEMPSMPRVPPAQAAAAGLTGAVSNKVAGDMPDAQPAFCKENAIQLSWASSRKAGSGLVNLGNTCFMNAVLQCLTHTPPLAELCMREAGLSTSAADKQHLDPIVAMQAHIKKALLAPNPVRPMWHASNLKAINRRFRLGRQEDAHEYLRCVLDAMHEAFLKHIQPKPPPELAATTFIHRIFGGKLRSEIVCEGVDYRSATFDPFLDLSLEITKANSLARALQHFTAEEVLDGDNRYRCPKNNKLVKAYKRISIENAPNVLTVHLKRFDFFGRGHKVSKRVDFDTQLDLGPFMTSHLQRRHHHHIHKHKHHHHHPQQQQQQHAAGPQQQHHHHHGHHVPMMYDLYAVLVHHGHSLHSGHYVAFVKAGNGMWHHCDDHRVAPVSERMVEGQQAYILFYVRRQLKGSRAAAAAAVQAAASAAVAAAAAGNREQQRQLQREQLRQQKQQDSSKPGAAGGGAAAPAAAAAGVSAGVQETGSVSAADGRKVVTSSTESTANASPADDADGQQQVTAVDFTPQKYSQAQLQKLLHNHNHFTRSRRGMYPLSSFERHLKYASEAAATAMRLQRRSSKRLSGLPNGLHAHNGLSEHSKQPQQQQHLGLLGGSPLKQARRIKPQAVVLEASQQQQQQGAEGQPPKRQRQDDQAQASQQQQQQEQQQQPVRAQVAQSSEQQQAKRPKHADGSSSRAEQPSQQQQQLPEQQHKQPQQASQAPKPSAAGPAQQQQQQQHQRAAPVMSNITGAAALELALSTSPLTRGWEGGDESAAAAAASLERAAAQAAKRKARDEWDMEYDRGKTKKVRAKAAAGEDGEGAEEGAGGNRFQQAWQQQLPQKARQEAWRGMGDGGQQRRGGGRSHGSRGGGHRGVGGRHGGGGRGRPSFGGRGGGGGGRGRGRGGFGGGRGRGGGGGRGRGGGGGRGH